ncbi:MAG TPA: PAS domain S-box protein [Longimicrobium sp.]|nr:PAS domain S-box protein [Longimicrobium sp.]HSU16447.1 PAS domain S-box protein [Longimicrobium sp.]
MSADTTDLHRLLVESVRDYAIFVLDRTGHVLTWNPGVERLKGYTADEIIGRHFSTFYPAEDLAWNKPAWELEVATREGRFEDEGWRLRKDGSRFWANVVITALRDEMGELVGFAKVTRDLTERRAAEEELRQSEQRFRLLVQNVRDYAIFMLDPGGHIISWNEGAQHINGYSEAEILGRHFSIFYPDEDIGWGKPPWELEVATSEGRFEEEGWRIRKNGERFWANVVITALRAPGGELLGFTKVTRDLTERRASMQRELADARRLAAEETARAMAESRAQELGALNEQLRTQAEELEQRRREAEQANRVKSEFLAAMSHELRTPLNAIGGYAQLLAMGIQGPVNEEQEAALHRIQRSQQHLLGLINDILNFSRMEAGEVTYAADPIPVQDAVEAASEIVAVSAKTRGVALEVRPGAPATVLGDRPKLDQILLNLLSNAIKFTEPGGRVTLEHGVEDGRVAIRVRDTGIGIPADKLEAVFEPFVQVGRSLTHPAEGTGLGLAISRDLARGMGGDLTAVSTEGKGSVFSLTLPLSP